MSTLQFVICFLKWFPIENLQISCAVYNLLFSLRFKAFALLPKLQHNFHKCDTNYSQHKLTNKITRTKDRSVQNLWTNLQVHKSYR